MADKDHKNTQNVEAGNLSRRALIDPQTVDRDAGEFVVVFATDAPVLMSPYWSDSYNEVLSMDGMRADRLDAGAPLLDNHARYGSVQKNVIGIVREHWKEGGKAYARIKLSAREELRGLMQDISDGIIRNVSCGYRVYKYDEKPRAEGEDIATYIASDWEPFEVSLVAVPADSSATVRSASEEKHNLIIQRHAPDGDGAKNPKNSMEEDNKTPEAQVERSAPSVDLEAERARAAEEAVKAERERVAQISNAVRSLKLGEGFAQKLIKDGVSADEARALAIAEWERQDPAEGVRTAGVEVGADGADKLRSAVGDALSMRAGQRVEKPAPGASDFRGMSLLRMAEEVLQSEGVSTRGMSRRQIAEVSLNARGYHTTSDFPVILGDTINRTLRAAYEYQERTFMPFCRRGNASDFREMTRAQISGLVGEFDEVLEGAEYKYGSMSDASEKYAVLKYGKIISLTWEALINDDLSAFSRIPTAIATKAAQKQNDIVWNILLDNANMADGNPLFSNAHSNLGSATAINETGLNAARVAMRTQKAIEGDYINLRPQYMLVGPDKETEAQKLLQATIVATKTADTNVFRGFADLIVEPRVTGNKWFVVADPNMIDTIEYSFLDGEAELFTEQKTGFDVDGLQVKARMVFGAKAIDWRGLYYNPGA